MALVVTNLCVGLSGGDYNDAFAKLKEKYRGLQVSKSDPATPERAAEIEKLQSEFEALRSEFEPIQKLAGLHFLLGVLAALVAVLVQSIGVTYFIGTGRWCKEVVEAYDLEADILAEGTRLKRRTFPWAMLGIATILAIVTLGGACDPNGGGRANWVPYHLFSGLFGTALLVFCMFRQGQGIHQNQAIIERLMRRVREERDRRGLDIDEQPAT